MTKRVMFFLLYLLATFAFLSCAASPDDNDDDASTWDQLWRQQN